MGTACLAEPPLRETAANRDRGVIPGTPVDRPWKRSPVIDDWAMLERFLILGREDGAYNAATSGLSLESAHSVFRCLVADGARVVSTLERTVEARRAARPEAALFVLALAASDRAVPATRAAALAAVPRVCRSGDQLLQFACYVDDLRGWGRGLRRAIAEWYRQPLEVLSREILSGRTQNGWSHRDLLRLAHPQPPSAGHQALFRWVTRGEWIPSSSPVPELRALQGMELARSVATLRDAAVLVRKYRLLPEHLTSGWSSHVEIWEALLDQLSTSDLLQNLPALAGAIQRTGDIGLAERAAAQLTDASRVRRSGVQPIQALAVWGEQADWLGQAGDPGKILSEALEAVFQLSLRNVTPTGKRWLTALDVSGSMGSSILDGMKGVSPRLAALALALATGSVDPTSLSFAYTAGSSGPGGRWGGGPTHLEPLGLRPQSRLFDVERLVTRLPMGGVDCALPMKWALRERIPVDVFVVMTDTETWYSGTSPAQALRDYRDGMGLDAKLAVVGMSSNGFRIADPKDFGMLDVIGFDLQVPQVLTRFAVG